MYRKSRGELLRQLNSHDKNIFTTAEIALLWEMTNKNNLYTALKRIVKDGALYRVVNGVYSKKPLNKVHQYEIACAVGGPNSYVSTETVLALEGIIMQTVYDITVVGKKAFKTKVSSLDITVRSTSPRFLSNRQGIVKEDNYYIASKERALADMLHYNPTFYYDNELAIDIDQVGQIKSLVYG